MEEIIDRKRRDGVVVDCYADESVLRDVHCDAPAIVMYRCVSSRQATQSKIGKRVASSEDVASHSGLCLCNAACSVEREPIPRKPTTGRYSLLPAWLGRRSDDGKKPFRSLIEVSDRYKHGHRGDGNAAKACEKLGVNCVVRGAFALTRSGSALHGIHAMNADLRLDGCRDLRWLRNVHRDGRTSVCPQRVALDIGALE